MKRLQRGPAADSSSLELQRHSRLCRRSWSVSESDRLSAERSLLGPASLTNRPHMQCKCARLKNLQRNRQSVVRHLILWTLVSIPKSSCRCFSRSSSSMSPSISNLSNLSITVSVTDNCDNNEPQRNEISKIYNNLCRKILRIKLALNIS